MIEKFRTFGKKYHQKSLKCLPLSRKSFWAKKFPEKFNRVSPNRKKSFLSSRKCTGKLSELHSRWPEELFAQKNRSKQTFWNYGENISAVLPKQQSKCPEKLYEEICFLMFSVVFVDKILLRGRIDQLATPRLDYGCVLVMYALGSKVTKQRSQEKISTLHGVIRDPVVRLAGFFFFCYCLVKIAPVILG